MSTQKTISPFIFFEKGYNYLKKNNNLLDDDLDNMDAYAIEKRSKVLLIFYAS
jgi:hypothetical protein